MAKVDLSIAIGGAAGQGIATPGDILARIFVRRGLHLNAYNAYQSIVRGGHIFLTLRTSDGANAGNVLLDVVRAAVAKKPVAKKAPVLNAYGFKNPPRKAKVRRAYADFVAMFV